MSYLGPKELLSLRRVSKSAKQWVSESSLSSAWNGYRLEIRSDYEGWQTFEDAVNSGLNVTEIYINNPGGGDDEDNGMAIYNSPALALFIQTYGPHIRKLKVRNFGAFHSDSEFDFFASLTNLQELKLEIVDARNRRTAYPGRIPPPHPTRFPPNFKNIRVLKLGDVLSPRDTGPFDTTYHWDIVDECPHLDYLRYPVTSDQNEGPNLNNRENFFNHIINYLMRQKAEKRFTLNTLDLKYISDSLLIHHVSFEFICFVELTYIRLSHQLQFRNVHAELLETMNPSSRNLGIYDEAIVSMINLVPTIRLLGLPNLEKISINSTASSHLMHDAWDAPPDYDKLSSISILFDEDIHNLEHRNVFTVTDYLFHDKPRKRLRKLSIVFEEECSRDQLLIRSIRCRRMAKNFSNLKILEIVGWNVPNRSFLRLWNELTLLEELIIADCETFGNVALIGENPLEPTFLKLKKLRKLKFKLDKIPNLTDRAFRDVLCHMNLKEFYLESYMPLEKITPAGIQCLLSEKFGESIEKFPFSKWSLALMSLAEFKELGKKFRCIF